MSRPEELDDEDVEQLFRREWLSVISIGIDHRTVPALISCLMMNADGEKPRLIVGTTNDPLRLGKLWCDLIEETHHQPRVIVPWPPCYSMDLRMDGRLN